MKGESSPLRLLNLRPACILLSLAPMTGPMNQSGDLAHQAAP
jgi:hypothetical protein